MLGDTGSVAGGTSRKRAESIHRRIGIGDCDVCDRLVKFVIGDRTSEMDLVPINSTGGVNEGWVGLVCLSKGGVVGKGVPTLVDACDNGEVILLFNVIGDAGSEDVWWWRGHMSWSLFCMVFILLVPPNLAKSSGACRSFLSTQESCAGEYPFHLMRYCFFFHRPYMCTLIIFSTSHSSSLMISGGGSIKFGLC